MRWITLFLVFGGLQTFGQSKECQQAEIHFILAEQQQADDPMRCLQELNKALFLCPNYSPARLMRGDWYLNHLALDSAELDFRHYRALNPNSGTAFRKLAGVKYYRGDLDSCHYFLDEGLARDPKDSMLVLNKGEVFYYQGKWEEAEVWFGRYRAIDPKSLVPLLRLCDIKMGDRKIAECWKLVELMKSMDAGNYDVYISEVNLLILEQQFDLALKKLEQAEHIDSMQTATFFARARVYMATEKNDLALNEYNKVLMRDPENPDAYLERGNLLYEMDQAKLALLDFREALSIDSTLADAWGQLGVVYIELQQYEMAIDAMNQALKYDIDNPDYWYNRGNAYYNLQDYKNAITNYSKSIELNNNIDAVYNRALCYYLDNQFNLAIPDFSEYLLVQSADAQAWYLRCLCNYELGRKENACSDCEMAVFLGNTEVPASMIKYCGIKKKKKK